MRRLASLAIAALALLAVALADPRRRTRREHTAHGTVRKLCDPVRMRKWPGGPSAGRVPAGKDLRRYHFEGAWALGVTTKRPFIRGWALTAAFCPPSARAGAPRRWRARLATHPPAGRPASRSSARCSGASARRSSTCATAR